MSRLSFGEREGEGEGVGGSIARLPILGRASWASYTWARLSSDAVPAPYCCMKGRGRGGDRGGGGLDWLGQLILRHGYFPSRFGGSGRSGMHFGRMHVGPGRPARARAQDVCGGPAPQRSCGVRARDRSARQPPLHLVEAHPSGQGQLYDSTRFDHSFPFGGPLRCTVHVMLLYTRVPPFWFIRAASDVNQHQPRV